MSRGYPGSWNDFPKLQIYQSRGAASRQANKLSSVGLGSHTQVVDVTLSLAGAGHGEEIQALRAQRDMLFVAIRNECAKFHFPEEDRPELWEVFEKVCRARRVRRAAEHA